MQSIVTLADTDSFADLFARRTRLDGVDRPNIRVAVARAGYRLLRAPPGVRWRELAQWARVGSERRIYLSPQLDDAASAHPIAHEAAHCLLDELGLRVDGDIERWCHRWASAFLCPAVSARRAWRWCGADLPAFVRRWAHMPSTAVALRVQEAVGLPTFVFVDGQPRYPANDVPGELRAIARHVLRAGDLVLPGLQARRLPREPGRVAIVLEHDLEAA